MPAASAAPTSDAGAEAEAAWFPVSATRVRVGGRSGSRDEDELAFAATQVAPYLPAAPSLRATELDPPRSPPASPIDPEVHRSRGEDEWHDDLGLDVDGLPMTRPRGLWIGLSAAGLVAAAVVGAGAYWGMEATDPPTATGTVASNGVASSGEDAMTVASGPAAGSAAEQRAVQAEAGAGEEEHRGPDAPAEEGGADDVDGANDLARSDVEEAAEEEGEGAEADGDADDASSIDADADARGAGAAASAAPLPREALETFDLVRPRLSRRARRLSDAQRRQNATHLKTRALRAYRSAEYAEAEQLYREALTFNTWDVAAVEGLARTLAQQERFPEALAWARLAVERNPRSATAHRVVGDVWRQAGHPDEAIRAYRRGLARSPNDRWLRRRLADVRRR